LAYNRFRYYDCEEGIYISQDPIGLLSGQPNFYAYVKTPNLFTDRFGLSVTYVGFKRWKRGDAIDKPMPNGSNPDWGTVRSRYWKNRHEATVNSGEFRGSNLERMNQGSAPKDYNPRTGQEESRELHHVNPQRNNGSNGPINLRELTPEQHAAIDPYRHLSI